MIRGTRSLLDDEWHSVRAEREGPVAALYIDEKLEVENRSFELGGSDSLTVQPLVYIGGLPVNLVPFAARILPASYFIPICLVPFNFLVHFNDTSFIDYSNNILFSYHLGIIPIFTDICSKNYILYIV